MFGILARIGIKTIRIARVAVPFVAHVESVLYSRWGTVGTNQGGALVSLIQ